MMISMEIGWQSLMVVFLLILIIVGIVLVVKAIVGTTRRGVNALERIADRDSRQ